MIDKFSLLQEARNFYSTRSYTFMDVPWIVSREAIDMTLPAGACPHVVAIERHGSDPTQPEKDNPDTTWDDWRGYLVGSAEQSFAQAILSNDPYIHMGTKYMAITPCFRDDEEDMIHFEYFMKLELFYFDAVKELAPTLEIVKKDAFDFFNRHIHVKWVETPEGFDLVSRDCNVELGSYGIRLSAGAGYGWVYGTGLAQPRLNQVIERTTR